MLTTLNQRILQTKIELITISFNTSKQAIDGIEVTTPISSYQLMILRVKETGTDLRVVLIKLNQKSLTLLTCRKREKFLTSTWITMARKGTWSLSKKWLEDLLKLILKLVSLTLLCCRLIPINKRHQLIIIVLFRINKRYQCKLMKYTLFPYTNLTIALDLLK